MYVRIYMLSLLVLIVEAVLSVMYRVRLKKQLLV